MHWFHGISFLLFATAANVSAFSPSEPASSLTLRHSRAHDNVALCMTTPSSHNNPSRRLILIQSAALSLATLLPSAPAFAKTKQAEPTTPENVQAAFDALRFELQDPKGGISIMQDYIDKQDFDGLLEFTKTYDQVLRKQKWGRCKALLTGNAEKEVATLQGNAVTFDLIGINRASRPGQESQEQANKYLKELRVDVQKMIDMQDKIQYQGEGGFDEYYNSIQGK